MPLELCTVNCHIVWLLNYNPDKLYICTQSFQHVFSLFSKQADYKEIQYTFHKNVLDFLKMTRSDEMPRSRMRVGKVCRECWWPFSGNVFPEETEENHRLSAIIAYKPTDIRTGHLPNTNVECYHYTNSLDPIHEGKGGVEGRELEWGRGRGGKI
jgi:hypothetical protein